MNPVFSKAVYRLRTSFGARAGIAALLVLILLAACFLFLRITDPFDCRIVQGVTIDGVQVGGMTKHEARKALQSAAEERLLSQPLTVILPEEVWNLNPAELELDIRKAVKDAYAIGRKQNSDERSLSLESYLSIPLESLRTRLEAYAQDYNTTFLPSEHYLVGDVPDLSEAGFDADAPCQQIVITIGVPESHLDVEAALTQIQNAYHQGISAEPGAYRVELSMVIDRLPDDPDWEAIHAKYTREAVNADVDMQSYTVTPAAYGQSFDLDAFRNRPAPTNWGQTISIPLYYQTPEILSDMVYFRDVLGSCETRHTDDENRNTNLRLVCEILDGYILQPGEEFSYNGVVGERTPERGFKTATAYSGTRVIKDFGGGVCQGSSTLYNCVLLADMEVTDRVCHGYTVGYLPIGLDAAVNWATKTDFKFRNNFHFPVQIKAKLEDGYMKMQILGVDEKDYYVEMRSGRSDEEHRIYSNSYKYKYDKETGELISKELEARSSYMYQD